MVMNNGLMLLLAMLPAMLLPGVSASGERPPTFSTDSSVSFPNSPRLSDRIDSLPDHVVAQGDKHIARAWLVYPARHYDHGVLGDAVEAAGVRVDLRDGRQFTLRLMDRSVFEDRYPRLLDADGDGDDEMVLVHSYPDRGAALAVLEVDDRGIRFGAESRPIGTAYRWLNPVGSGDFDGDGAIEIGAVLMPHLDGSLVVYRYDGKALRRIFKGGASRTM